MQCTDCPKAYCIDCFPQSFRRIYPDPTFFEDLQSKGMDTALPGRMVNYLCNECRLERTNAEINAEAKASVEAEKRAKNAAARKAA